MDWPVISRVCTSRPGSANPRALRHWRSWHGAGRGRAVAKLLIAVVHAQDAAQLVEALRGAELRVTEVLSRGGFLQARNAMLYIGVEDEQVPMAMRLIEENCSSRTENVPAEPLGGIDANW